MEEFDPLDPLGLITRMKRSRDFVKKVVDTVVSIADSLASILEILEEIRDDVREIKEIIENLGGDISGSLGEDSKGGNGRSRKKVRKSR